MALGEVLILNLIGSRNAHVVVFFVVTSHSLVLEDHIASGLEVSGMRMWSYR